MTKEEFYKRFNQQRRDFLNTSINTLEKKYNKEYEKLFKELNYNITQKISKYKDDNNNYRSLHLTKMKKDIDEEIRKFNKEWNIKHEELLKRASINALDDTKSIYKNFSLDSLTDNVKWNKNIMDYLISYKAQDGLNISDRLWGHSKQIRDNLINTLQKNILAGESVWDTMMELKNTPNVEIPKYLREQFDLMGDKQIQKTVDLYTVKKTNYMTRRLVESEIERAYRTTNQKLVEEKEWIKGLKWNLSSKHKYGEYDCVCEDNSTANNFKMGKGVYPPKYYPPAPAHPRCKCYDSEIFNDEVIQKIEDIE